MRVKGCGLRLEGSGLRLEGSGLRLEAWFKVLASRRRREEGQTSTGAAGSVAAAVGGHDSVTPALAPSAACGPRALLAIAAVFPEKGSGFSV